MRQTNNSPEYGEASLQESDPIIASKLMQRIGAILLTAAVAMMAIVAFPPGQ
jgi:hypothetical protein